MGNKGEEWRSETWENRYELRNDKVTQQKKRSCRQRNKQKKKKTKPTPKGKRKDEAEMKSKLQKNTTNITRARTKSPTTY